MGADAIQFIEARRQLLDKPFHLYLLEHPPISLVGRRGDPLVPMQSPKLSLTGEWLSKAPSI